MSTDEDADGDSPEGIDVHALLAAVVDKPPPEDLADRVAARLALAETVAEFGRLFSLVPGRATTDAMGRDDDDNRNVGEDDDD